MFEPQEFRRRSPREKEEGDTQMLQSFLCSTCMVLCYVMIATYIPPYSTMTQPKLLSWRTELLKKKMQRLGQRKFPLPASMRMCVWRAAWLVIMGVVAAIRNNPVWYCGRCTRPIPDDTQSSMVCECCLGWFHFECLGIKQPPKAMLWFCRKCCATVKGPQLLALFSVLLTQLTTFSLSCNLCICFVMHIMLKCHSHLQGQQECLCLYVHLTRDVAKVLLQLHCLSNLFHQFVGTSAYIVTTCRLRDLRLES